MNIKEIKKYIKENGESEQSVIEKIGHGCIKYVDIDFDVTLLETGCWDGESFADEVVKYVFIDSEDNVWVLAMDEDTYNDCDQWSSPDQEIFCYEPTLIEDYDEDCIAEICSCFE